MTAAAKGLRTIREAKIFDAEVAESRADSYGPDVSERLIGETLSPFPKGLVVATKGGLTRQGPDRWSPNGRPITSRRK
jgi:hypothetical protein